MHSKELISVNLAHSYTYKKPGSFRDSGFLHLKRITRQSSLHAQVFYLQSSPRKYWSAAANYESNKERRIG